MVNLEWVAPRALRHEEVVIAAMEQGPVLPVRFGTVFSSLVAVTEALRLRQDVFEKFFQNTAGMNEWILKGYANLPQNRVRMTLERMAAEKEQLAELSGETLFWSRKSRAKWLRLRRSGSRGLERKSGSWPNRIRPNSVNVVSSLGRSPAEMRRCFPCRPARARLLCGGDGRCDGRMEYAAEVPIAPT